MVKIDRETKEILTDSKAMESITKGLRDFEKGKYKSFEQIKKELKLNI